MQTPRFTDSLREGDHHWLQHLCGRWQGPMHTFFEPGAAPVHSEWNLEIESVLGGRFLLLRYASEIDGKAHEGIALLGRYLLRHTWEMVWADSFHTGTQLMFSTGKGVHPELGGHYAVPDGTADWGWKTKLELDSQGRLLWKAWNQSPNGNEDLALDGCLVRNAS